MSSDDDDDDSTSSSILDEHDAINDFEDDGIADDEAARCESAIRPMDTDGAGGHRAGRRFEDALKSQKELVYNRYLPYADLLDDEASLALAKIKGNLGRAILLRELKPGCSYWTAQLSAYISNYGLKMSKSDHLALVRLLYELTTMPDLDYSLVRHFAHLSLELLKKRHLLSRQDLILPWRPLYEVYKRVCLCQWKKVRMVRVPSGTSLAVTSLIRVARTYFPVGSTEEMLAEWRPWLCPFVRAQTKKAMQCFELFLPVVVLKLDEHEQGFRLWFDEFMQIWLSCHANSSWESNLMALFARLTHENVGHIDWNPYIPMIFTRLLRGLQLPVTMKKVRLQGVKEIYNINTISTFLVALLGGQSDCQKHLDQLFKTLQSFYHPSNSGSWNFRLQQILSSLSSLILFRLRRERGLIETWLQPIPQESCLTESDVTVFVLCLRPCVLLSMFSKSGCKPAAVALRNLSFLRPEHIVPLVLDKFYPAVETLTEPHRLLAVLQCLAHVSVALFGEKQSEGDCIFDARQHVLPILNSCLPAIDPNDMNKSMSAFQLLSCLLYQVPLVDYSGVVADHPEMPEAERELCLATCQFEDFVLLFLDRCFLLIENVSVEPDLTANGAHFNAEEQLVQCRMRGVLSLILDQCSPAIFQVAVRKLHDFIIGRIMGIKDAGYMFAKLVRETVMHGDGFSFQLFLPDIARVIEDSYSDIDLDGEANITSNPGNEMLFNMLLLQELMCCDGRILVAHRVIIISLLKKVVRMSYKDGHAMACNTLKNLLWRLTQVYCSDFAEQRFDDCATPNSDLHPIKEWGKTVDMKTLKVAWHVVSANELQFAQELVDTFLGSELERLERFCDEQLVMSSEGLQQSLASVYSILLGCLGLCPLLNDDKVPLFESIVDTEMTPFAINVKDTGVITLFGGKNLRNEVAAIVRRLNKFVLEKHEDNTVALNYVAKIYFRLMFYWGTECEAYEHEWKNWLKDRRLIENPFRGRKRRFRQIVIQRVSLQHHLRLSLPGLNIFTEGHKLLMSDLLRLSVSHYAEVRVQSQLLLASCFTSWPYSCNFLLPEIMAVLNSTARLEHHVLKGFLYVLIGVPTFSLIIKRDWRVISLLWPVAVQTPISDKPSINALLDKIAEKVNKQFVTFSISEQISVGAFGSSRDLWSSTSNAVPLEPLPTCEELSEAETLAIERNATTLRIYEDLFRNQARLLAESPDIHWQNFQLGVEFLSHLVRHDVVIPAGQAPVILLKALICDYPLARRAALSAIVRILQQLKQRVPRVEADPNKVAGDADCHLYYDTKTVPCTREEWNATYFVDKPSVGFYQWPKKLLIHAPPGQQPNRFKFRNEMGDVEGVIYDFFAESFNVERLVNHLSAEGNADHGKLNLTRCYLFKHLFRNYGDVFVETLKPNLQRLAESPRDSHQRCALEIVSGVVAGSKHWPFDLLTRLLEYVVPFVRLLLTRVNAETQSDWSHAISFVMSNRDPRRMKWLLELLMEDMLVSTDGSFLEANRLLLLVVALNEHSWRLPSFLCRVMDVIRPHLSHPYQNIRDELGRVLSLMFMTDVDLRPFRNGHRGPLQRSFVDDVVCELATFETMVAVQALSNSENGSVMDTVYESDPAWKSSVALLKTVCRWLQRRILKSHQWTSLDLFKLFGILCQGEGCDRDPELQVNCRVSIAIMAHSLLPPAALPSALDTVAAVCKSESWRSRRTSIEYLQILIFSNLFILLSHPECIIRVREMVLLLLQDVRPEVQQAAALALSGMFHSEILKADRSLLEMFKSLCKTPVRRRKNVRVENGIAADTIVDALQRRYAGILGLCAFVEAHPYDIVDNMPDVLGILGDHLHDPQPLQGSVRQALTNFWRTHRDNWHDHKLKFTGDQLTVLTDLHVSPNYYA